MGGDRSRRFAGPGADLGLIWLDYLRARERRLTIEGLVLYLPVGRERTTCLRLRWLDPRAAQYLVLAFGTDGYEDEVDVRDYGNLDTRVETSREQPAGAGEPGPEKWLETRIRSQIRLVDSSLLERPVYGQVPQFTAGERDVVDLLGSRTGRPFVRAGTEGKRRRPPAHPGVGLLAARAVALRARGLHSERILPRDPPPTRSAATCTGGAGTSLSPFE